jgi:hypothetical protein
LETVIAILSGIVTIISFIIDLLEKKR